MCRLIKQQAQLLQHDEAFSVGSRDASGGETVSSTPGPGPQGEAAAGLEDQGISQQQAGPNRKQSQEGRPRLKPAPLLKRPVAKSIAGETGTTKGPSKLQQGTGPPPKKRAGATFRLSSVPGTQPRSSSPGVPKV